jgi:small subunit ribosomal protein S8
MQVTDPVADYLTRIRNAQMAGHRIVEIPASNLKKRMTEILMDQGYISKFTFEPTENNQGVIKIALRYDKVTKRPVIRELKRLSRPGLRRFAPSTEIPRVMNGLGICILSTSRGLLTDKQARESRVGGELLCSIF